MDSEHLACGLSARFLTEAGYTITANDFIRRFCGQGKSYIYNTISGEIGYDILPKINMELKDKEQQALFTAELKEIAGVTALLKSLSVPMAIASGSGYERLYFTLDLIGLRDAFGPHIYSSSDVAHGKPAPDVFLYAAEKLGVAPADCLVIEDSLNGVKAGKAAGMTVYGFAGGSHVLDKEAHLQELKDLGADWVFSDMQALVAVLTQYGLAA
jgi:HAD superfamily hydrolase (TIGR01509 family)